MNVGILHYRFFFLYHRKALKLINIGFFLISYGLLNIRQVVKLWHRYHLSLNIQLWLFSLFLRFCLIRRLYLSCFRIFFITLLSKLIRLLELVLLNWYRLLYISTFFIIFKLGHCYRCSLRWLKFSYFNRIILSSILRNVYLIRLGLFLKFNIRLMIRVLVTPGLIEIIVFLLFLLVLKLSIILSNILAHFYLIFTHISKLIISSIHITLFNLWILEMQTCAIHEITFVIDLLNILLFGFVYFSYIFYLLKIILLFWRLNWHIWKFLTV